jgi:hypothetical protein
MHPTKCRFVSKDANLTPDEYVSYRNDRVARGEGNEIHRYLEKLNSIIELPKQFALSFNERISRD